MENSFHPLSSDILYTFCILFIMAPIDRIKKRASFGIRFISCRILPFFGKSLPFFFDFFKIFYCLNDDGEISMSPPTRTHISIIGYTFSGIMKGFSRNRGIEPPLPPRRHLGHMHLRRSHWQISPSQELPQL